MHQIHTVTTTLTMTVPDTYGYVLLVAVVIAFEIILIGFLFPGRTRGRVFNKEFLEKHYGEEHKNATGNQIGKEGYPDTGNGWYSKHLSYKDWFDFNNAQRAHYNFVEMAPSTFVMLFIAGLYFSIAAAAIGLALAVFRMIYSCGYSNSGPTGRLIGAIGNDLCLLGLLGLSFASGVMWVKGESM